MTHRAVRTDIVPLTNSFHEALSFGAMSSASNFIQAIGLQKRSICGKRGRRHQMQNQFYLPSHFGSVCWGTHSSQAKLGRQKALRFISAALWCYTVLLTIMLDLIASRNFTESERSRSYSRLKLLAARYYKSWQNTLQLFEFSLKEIGKTWVFIILIQRFRNNCAGRAVSVALYTIFLWVLCASDGLTR